MKSGDRVQAAIVTFEADHFELRPRWSEDALRLPQGELLMVQRRNRTASRSESPPHRLVYDNGDEISGTLLELGEETLALKSDWGETLTLNRSGLQRVEMRAAVARIEVDGIARMDAWGGQPWRVGPDTPFPVRVGGEIFQQHPQRHRYALPFPAIEQSFVVDLGMRVPEQTVNFMLRAFQDMNIQMHQGTLRLNSGNRGASAMGFDNWSTEMAEVPEGSRRVKLIFDATSSTMHLYVNRQHLRTWQIRAEGPLPFHQPTSMDLSINSGDPVTIDRYKVLSYPSSPPLPAEEPGEGYNARISLQNGDQLQGNIERIANGMISMTLENEIERDLTLNVVSEIRFAASDSGSTALKKERVEVRLGPAESRFVLTHADFDGEYVRGTSPHLNSPLQIPWAEVDLIDFNPAAHSRR
ncbi:MAG: hypothetical protein JJU29_14895 [Verrucomicrobia bacterium]|nr:hypothetical protein [Verrucomicrobiota bacterium]MCH8513274.1 hypothetical protein [Kiritimatiellia bacterium]